MKYWGYLAAKLAAGSATSYAAFWAAAKWYPEAAPLLRDTGQERFTHDLGYTFLMLACFLLALGLLYLILWDQRLRCRTCLRRLRMPVASGSWTHILLSPPNTEYICPFGHGTLKVPEYDVTGPQPAHWREHEDIWKELEAQR